MLRIATIVLLLAGCASNNANGEPPQAPAPEPTEQPAPPPPSDATAAEEVTPASLYAECRDRVENPQADAECTKDEDCVKAGCGSEVCTTGVAAADIMTTCEDRPCFQVLDTCGCHDGVCSWTLKDEIPPRQELKPAEPQKLQNKLPKAE